MPHRKGKMRQASQDFIESEIDPTSEEYKNAVSSAPLSSKPPAEKEEEKIKVSFYVPKSVNKKIEEMRKRKKIKISKQHWILHVLMKELDMPDE